MIKIVKFVETECNNVFVNQGIEKALFENVKADELIVFLWVNEKAVVVGRNQDAYLECRVDALESEGGLLARRLSGGGAVYHDIGNLNFTFITTKDNFSVENNMKNILMALKSLGITATLSGRNDIEVEGCKISGNAYYSQKDKKLHHGTILINSLKEDIAKYLTPSSAKFEGKTVKSVQSRVSSLSNFAQNIDTQKMSLAIRESVANFYCDALIENFNPMLFGANKILDETAFFAKDDFRFGDKKEFEYIASLKVENSLCVLKFDVENDTVCDLQINTDSLDETLCKRICDAIINVDLNGEFEAIFETKNCDISKDDFVKILNKFREACYGVREV